MTIGERIKIARTNAGMTQADLAKIMGVPYQTIGHWERNASSPKYSSLEKVAQALNISIETLILGASDNGKSDNDSKDKAMVSAIEKVVKFLGISYDELLERTNFDPVCGTKGNIRFSDDGSAGLTLVQLGNGGRDGVLYLVEDVALAVPARSVYVHVLARLVEASFRKQLGGVDRHVLFGNHRAPPSFGSLVVPTRCSLPS